MRVAETVIIVNAMYSGTDKRIYFTLRTETCPLCLGSCSSLGNALLSMNNLVWILLWLCTKYHAKLRQNAEIHFPDDVKSLSMSQIRVRQFAHLCRGQYVELVSTCFDSMGFHQNCLS